MSKWYMKANVWAPEEYLCVYTEHSNYRQSLPECIEPASSVVRCSVMAVKVVVSGRKACIYVCKSLYRHSEIMWLPCLVAINRGVNLFCVTVHTNGGQFCSPRLGTVHEDGGKG